MLREEQVCSLVQLALRIQTVLCAVGETVGKTVFTECISAVCITPGGERR
jgi:hypothetical protein